MKILCPLITLFLLFGIIFCNVQFCEERNKVSIIAAEIDSFSDEHGYDNIVIFNGAEVAAVGNRIMTSVAVSDSERAEIMYLNKCMSEAKSARKVSAMTLIALQLFLVLAVPAIVLGIMDMGENATIMATIGVIEAPLNWLYLHNGSGGFLFVTVFMIAMYALAAINTSREY